MLITHFYKTWKSVVTDVNQGLGRNFAVTENGAYKMGYIYNL